MHREEGKGEREKKIEIFVMNIDAPAGMLSSVYLHFFMLLNGQNTQSKKISFFLSLFSSSSISSPFILFLSSHELKVRAEHAAATGWRSLEETAVLVGEWEETIISIASLSSGLGERLGSTLTKDDRVRIQKDFLHEWSAILACCAAALPIPQKWGHSMLLDCIVNFAISSVPSFQISCFMCVLSLSPHTTRGTRASLISAKWDEEQQEECARIPEALRYKSFKCC